MSDTKEIPVEKQESSSTNTPEENTVKIDIQQKTGLLKKLALIGSAILAIVIAIFSFNKKSDGYYKEKIAEGKKKDKELKEKADKISTEIKDLESKSAELEA